MANTIQGIKSMLISGLIFTLLMLVAYCSHGQDNTIIANDTATLTYTRVYNDVKAGLNGLAEGLKVGAEHVYIILVKQQVVRAITYSIVIIALTILAITLLTKGTNIAKPQKNTEESSKPAYRNRTDEWDFERGPAMAYMIIGGILGPITIAVFVVNIGDIIMGFVNPEYGAIKEIMKFIN